MRRHNKYRYIEDEDMRRHNYNYNVGIIHCPLPVHTCIGTCRKVRGSGWETLLGLVIVLHNTYMYTCSCTVCIDDLCLLCGKRVRAFPTVSMI